MRSLEEKSMAFLAGLFLTVCLFGASPALSLAQEHLGRARINGTVVDESGAPVEGALVVAQFMKAETKLEAQSDKKGRFSIAGLGSGMWRITASKSGYTPSSVEMEISQISSNPPVAFTLKKMAGLAALSADQDLPKMFDQGNLLINQGNYDDALKIFEGILTKYPDLYQVHLNLGTCYFKKEEMEKAEAEFKHVLDKALEKHGDYKKDASATMRAFAGLGEIALRRGDLDTAQKYLSQALEISPQDETAAYNVGEVFFSHQKADEAIRYFELAAQIKPTWSRPYLKLGYVYLNKGDLTKSLESFSKFLQMDPDSPEAPQVKNIIATIEKMKK